MARYWFGGGIADWTFTTQDAVGGFNDMAQVVPGATVTVWNAETGGTQYTDLLDSTGVAVTSITSSDGSDGRAQGTIPPFQGPDGVRELWAQAGSGPRALMQARLASELAAVVTQSQNTTDDFAAFAQSPPIGQPAVWYQDAVAATTGQYRWYNLTGRTVTLRYAIASVGGNIPAGSSIIVTIKLNGTEVFTTANRPTIPAGSRDSGAVTAFNTTAWPHGSYLTADVIQPGSTTAGSKLTIQAMAW